MFMAGSSESFGIVVEMLMETTFALSSTKTKFGIHSSCMRWSPNPLQ